jgi:hypothetical protein
MTFPLLLSVCIYHVDNFLLVLLSNDMCSNRGKFETDMIPSKLHLSCTKTQPVLTSPPLLFQQGSSF